MNRRGARQGVVEVASLADGEAESGIRCPDAVSRRDGGLRSRFRRRTNWGVEIGRVDAEKKLAVCFKKFG